MLRDLPHLVVRERREQHDLVDPVAEFRREATFQLAEHLALHLFDADVPRTESHRARQLPEVFRAEIGRHDDDGVAQIDALAAAIGEPALVERLQEEIEQARTGLLHFVEQDDREGVVLELIRQDSAALAADNAARHPDQLVHGDAAVLILGHVHANHLLLVAEQERRDRLGELGLPDAGRAEEQQHSVGAIESVFQRPLVQHQPARDGPDRVLLADDALLETLLDVLEAIGDVAVDHVLGDLSGVRNDRHHILLVDLPPAVHFGAHGSRVEPSDDLVGQMQVPHVARRHVERGFERLVEHADRVVSFQARAEVVENPPRFFKRRLGDEHRTEAARERFVFLDVFLVFAERRRGDHPDLAARERRLQHVGRVRRRAERRAGADHRVGLVHEQNEIGPLLQLADDVLDTILEHAAEHRARDHRVHLEVDHLAVAETDRHRLRLELDPPGEPFDDGRLADARLADEHHGIGALAVAEDLQHLLDFLVAAVDAAAACPGAPAN